MPEGAFRYCDVALPVPLDRLFTYELPLTLRHRVQPGCRVVAPFGTRKLTGIVLKVHDEAPSHNSKEIFSLTDEEPVLDSELIHLAQWIAEYYCAPVGEVLKGMLPLGGETRRSTQYSLDGRGTTSRKSIDHPAGKRPWAAHSCHACRTYPRTATQLTAKIPNARPLLRGLVQRAWVVPEDKEEDRDPCAPPPNVWKPSFYSALLKAVKLKKAERELLAYLELHPGLHNLGELAPQVKKASESARALAKRELIKLEVAGIRPPSGYERPRPELNAHQEAAFRQR